MEKKKINKDKILNSISNEGKFQKEKYKLLWFNSQLKESQLHKLENLIIKSKEKVAKLKDKLNGK